MRVDRFDFHLPPELIAERPLEQRERARLLYVRPSEAVADRTVADLPGLLRPGDLMVFNDTRVIPARLYGRRGAVPIEVLLHRPQTPDTWSGLSRPAKRLRVGQIIDFEGGLAAEVLAKDGGWVTLRFNRAGALLLEAVKAIGHVPLPPYIRRADDARDRADYQTIFAARDGAVAAPTAGLHFTPSLTAALEAAGIGRIMVTLHVGAGTFLPVSVEDTDQHVMHAEWGEITDEAAAAVRSAQSAGKRIVAVGTTALRVLETAAASGRVEPFCGDTALFITPGYRFRAVDVLFTNFHLPRSTLYMLVSAFAGTEVMRAAYAHAIARGYRFFSYGDACLLERAAS